MIPFKPVFTITASRQGERRTVNASSPADVLDVIGDFSAAGFSLEMVFDEEGRPVDPMDVLRRSLEQG